MGHYNSVVPLTSDRLGNFDRVRVDSAQTSFFEGREFLVAHEFSIPTGQTAVIKLVTLRPVIVQMFNLNVDNGHLRFARKTGGTEGGSFATPISIGKTNSMPGPTDQRLWDGLQFQTNTVMSTGGTLAGGSEFDIIRLKTANANAQAVTVGSTTDDQIGVPPGTRYYVLQNLGNDTATGVLRVRWEERA